METYLAKADAVRARELAATESPFTIEIRFVGGLTDTQQAAFARAGTAGRMLLSATCRTSRSTANSWTTS